MVDYSPLDDPLITTFGRFLEASARLQRSVGQTLEESSGMPVGWFEVLLRLSRSEGGRLTMGALAEQIVLTTGGVTRLVDRMTSAGLVERQLALGDRRLCFACITAEGRTRLEQAAATHSEELRRIFAGFTAQDLSTLDRLLDRLRTLPAP